MNYKKRGVIKEQGGEVIFNVYNNFKRTKSEQETLLMLKTKTAEATGGLSVAVPAEVEGYWQLHQRFGKLPWRKIVEPSLAFESGIEMNNLTYRNVELLKDVVLSDKGLREIFINPVTNDTYEIGQKYFRPKLMETLKTIAKEGGRALHNGSLTKNFVKDIQAHGGILTENDLNTCSIKIERPVQRKFRGRQTYSIFSIGLPGSGPILAYILNILENFLPKHRLTLQGYQRIIEALKFGYGMRTNLGDTHSLEMSELIERIISKKLAQETRKEIFDSKTFSDPTYYGAIFEPVRDHGTANLCVWGKNGDGISMTSSINFILGAGFVSKSTGIILNDSMDDFSTPGFNNEYGLPPSPSNFIRPRAQPLSSMCPTIVLDGLGNLILVIGGAGGSRITSSVLEVIVNFLHLNMDIRAASDRKRCHHQLFPMTLYLEEAWQFEDQEVVEGLRRIGHNITYHATDGFNAVTAIALDRKTKKIVGTYDSRRPGSVSYLNEN